jgi:hypothetical protein
MLRPEKLWRIINGPRLRSGQGGNA